MNNSISHTYDIVFISTFIDNESVEQLVSSIENNIKSLKIFVILINQSDPTNVLSNLKNINIIVLTVGRLSLSKARNIGINYIIDNKIQASHFMFPDDDSSFDKYFFENYQSVVEKGKNYLIDVYCEGTDKLYRNNNYQDGDILTLSKYEAAMSVNMIIEYNTFLKVGYFDENLGVGAKYGAGEDGDYYIRCCKVSGYFIYIKQLHTFHPSPNDRYNRMPLHSLIKRFNNYGRGVIYMQCKHSFYKDALATSIRAIGGAFYYLLKGNFRLFGAYICSFFSRISLFVKCRIVRMDRCNTKGQDKIR